jgi:hypothetical protein
MAPASKKFSQNSKAYKFLKAAMEKGEIDPNESPKAVFDTHQIIFDGYTLSQVRSGFNKIKAIVGCHVRDAGKWLCLLCFLNAIYVSHRVYF